MNRTLDPGQPRRLLVLRSLIDWALIGICLAAFLFGPSSLVGLVVPAMVWEFVHAFYGLFLSNLRVAKGSLMSWFFVGSVSIVVLIYAVAVNGWALLTFAVLSSRYLLSEKAGQIQSVFANTVQYVFAVFPAGFVAYMATQLGDLTRARGVVLFAGLYFLVRWFFANYWDPYRWLDVDWHPG